MLALPKHQERGSHFEQSKYLHCVLCLNRRFGRLWQIVSLPFQHPPILPDKLQLHRKDCPCPIRFWTKLRANRGMIYGVCAGCARNLSTLLLSTSDTPVSTKAGMGENASDP